MPKIPSNSSVMDKVPKKSVAEFFAGIGLMRVGLERAGWNVTWANDIDADKASIYRNHFRDADEHLLVQDVHLLDADRIPAVILATASFPCTDLSLAGGRRGLAGTGSGAFWGFIKAIEGMGTRRPPLVLLENVTGFLTSKGGADFRDACLALNDLGYWVDAFILDAADHVPQSRKRLFVVGSLGSPKDRKPQRAPLIFASPTRPDALVDFIAANPSIHWAVRDLPHAPRGTARLSDILEEITLDSDVWWDEGRARAAIQAIAADAASAFDPHNLWTLHPLDYFHPTRGSMSRG